MTAKSTSIKGAEHKFGGCAQKAVGLTSGDLRRVLALRELQSGYTVTIAGKAARTVVQAASAAKRAWAACLRKIFGAPG